MTKENQTILDNQIEVEEICTGTEEEITTKEEEKNQKTKEKKITKKSEIENVSKQEEETLNVTKIEETTKSEQQKCLEVDPKIFDEMKTTEGNKTKQLL